MPAFNWASIIAEPKRGHFRNRGTGGALRAPFSPFSQGRAYSRRRLAPKRNGYNISHLFQFDARRLLFKIVSSCCFLLTSSKFFQPTEPPAYTDDEITRIGSMSDPPPTHLTAGKKVSVRALKASNDVPFGHRSLNWHNPTPFPSSSPPPRFLTRRPLLPRNHSPPNPGSCPVTFDEHEWWWVGRAHDLQSLPSLSRLTRRPNTIPRPPYPPAKNGQASIAHRCRGMPSTFPSYIARHFLPDFPFTCSW